MAKELKKEEKKLAAKPAKKTVAKKIVKRVKTVRSAEDIAQEKVNNAAYFLLITIGVALLMTAFTLRITNYIGTEVMVISFALALVFIVTSIFVNKNGK